MLVANLDQASSGPPRCVSEVKQLGVIVTYERHVSRWSQVAANKARGVVTRLRTTKSSNQNVVSLPSYKLPVGLLLELYMQPWAPY